MTDTPKFPDNPDHANGTCEDCGAPCHVYGCRWCPACYDAGSARIREVNRAARTVLPVTAAVQSFAMATERLLRQIRLARPELDVAVILAWANAQAFASPARDSLHYLEAAYRAVVAGEPLPWLPATAAVTRNESN